MTSPLAVRSGASWPPRFDMAALREVLCAYQWREMMTCFRFSPPPGGDRYKSPEDLLRWKERNARQAAVLLLFLERQDGIHLLLTERQPELKHHAGEVALPGGRVDPRDASWQAAALRETAEEVGVPAQAIELWGQLDGLYIPPSNFLVAPFTGLLLDPSLVRASDPEVRSILEVPLALLFDPGVPASGIIGGRVVDFYAWQGYQIWGATARILNNLAEALGQPCEPSHLKIRGGASASGR